MPQAAVYSGDFPDAVAAGKLLSAARKAFILYPKNCSGSTHYVISQLVDPSAKYLLANELMKWLALPTSGWRKVSMLEASRLASRGQVVVGGLAQPGGHGHVIVVLPGLWKPSGGYQANGKLMRPHGSYPPAMSTSLGPWPGAMSNDDKTVRDPWNAADWAKVTFWAQP